MPETIMSADIMVDIAKSVLVRMPCKWGECDFVMTSFLNQVSLEKEHITTLLVESLEVKW
jgi:hypothetical protein